MKLNQGLVLLSVGIGIGAATSSILHAQSTLPAFTIAEIQVTNPDIFKEYAQATGAAIPTAGGRFIVRSGKSFVINGEPPKSIAVIQWENLEKARSFFESDDYKKLVPARDKGSQFRAFTVEGTVN
jgi:uncharacterized protein (DUF1330 family)